ncbi:MAG: hypothetical protein R2795_15280 [Saprospiraceae bacterium]
MKYLIGMMCLVGWMAVPHTQTADEFRAAAQQALEVFDVPGFSVGIIKDGQVVMAEGFGVLEKVASSLPMHIPSTQLPPIPRRLSLPA